MSSEMTSEGQQAGGKPTGDRMTVKQVVEYVRLYEEAIKKAAPTAWHRITLLFDKLKEFERELENLNNVMDELVYPEPKEPKGSHWFCFECGEGGPGREKRCGCDKNPPKFQFGQRVLLDNLRAFYVMKCEEESVFVFRIATGERAVPVEQLDERVALVDWMEKEKEGGA